VDAYIARFAAERDEQGRRLVVRNGYHQPREVLTSAGAIEVTVPRVNDKRIDSVSGERMRFSSAILPPWYRKTPKITEVLPLLYLERVVQRGLRARPPSPMATANRRSHGQICCATAPAAGLRAPVLAVGDGALSFWNALREVFPEAREGRYWFHKTANVLAALPKSAHPGAKKALAEIWGAEDKDHAQAAVKAFEAAYSAKFPKTTAKITDDLEELLAFYDYPASTGSICAPPTRSSRLS